MPLHKQVEQSQGEAHMGFKVVPTFVCHALELADVGEHGEDGFSRHAHIPFAPLTEAQIGRLLVRLSEAHVGKENHVVLILVHQALKRRAIVDVGGVTLPVDDATRVVQHETELVPDNPALVGEVFLADLSLMVSLPSRMQQLNAVAIDDPQQGRVSHERIHQVTIIHSTEQFCDKIDSGHELGSSLVAWWLQERSSPNSWLLSY